MSRLSTIFEFNNSQGNCTYIMLKSFRILNNYSLDEAVKFARTKGLKLVIIVVKPSELNSRNLNYFNEITSDLTESLSVFSNEIYTVNRSENIEEVLSKSSAIFVDKPYLRFDLDYLEPYRIFSFKNKISMFYVESNVFVPVVIASEKEEYSARTIRPKIHKNIQNYCNEVLSDLKPTKAETQAILVLKDFIDHKLEYYHLHNNPSNDYTSSLSVYLKYGFISPVTIYNHVRKSNKPNQEAFLEELIVRRELAYNFVYYNARYNKFDYISYDWAYKTMENHLDDSREYVYSIDDYLNFRTHDPYFNAAMKEMIYQGRMHSYMRMYWCKKIIEWSNTYKDAYEIAIYLNDYYFYDGMTPNGYCGVAWCFGKHDRAWTERPIFGKLRYMNASGLQRKFDIDEYVKKMDKFQRR